VIVGRLIPAGTGLAFHTARKTIPAQELFEPLPEGAVVAEATEEQA
jgi:hypothetical protein